MVIKTLKIELKEVGWANGVATKWQGFASLYNPETEKVERRIISDPCPSEESAMESLEAEAKGWCDISSQLLEHFEKERAKV